MAGTAESVWPMATSRLTIRGGTDLQPDMGSRYRDKDGVFFCYETGGLICRDTFRLPAFVSGLSKG